MATIFVPSLPEVIKATFPSSFTLHTLGFNYANFIKVYTAMSITPVININPWGDMLAITTYWTPVLESFIKDKYIPGDTFNHSGEKITNDLSYIIPLQMGKLIDVLPLFVKYQPETISPQNWLLFKIGEQLYNINKYDVITLLMGALPSYFMNIFVSLYKSMTKEAIHYFMEKLYASELKKFIEVIGELDLKIGETEYQWMKIHVK